MKSYLLAALVLLSNFVFSQKKVSPKDKNEIYGEGLALYTIILANWTSNDLYYENEFNTSIVKGYLSYKDKDTVKTIFWREIDTASAEYKTKYFKKVGDTGVVVPKDAPPQDLRLVIKTVRYKNLSVTKANSTIEEEEERAPTPYEKMLMDFRSLTYKQINSDTVFFKHYKGTQLKAVPIDMGKEIKVYVYSSVIKEGIIPFGGDYLLLFDKKTKEVKSRTDLHKECTFISTQYQGKQNEENKSSLHQHIAGAAQLITPTDIATLLLYKSQLEWNELQVVSDKYTSIFTLVDRKLDIMLTSEFESVRKKKVELEKEKKNSNFH